MNFIQVSPLWTIWNLKQDSMINPVSTYVHDALCVLEDRESIILRKCKFNHSGSGLEAQ